MRSFIYTKRKNPEMFIYMHKQQDTLTKSKTIHVTYLFTKTRRFTLRGFSINILNWHLNVYKKHDT